MLEELRISGLGVISDAVLELGPGLTVVTGETGAGKTMIVHGLALLFGDRLDSSLVAGDRAVVEGRLTVPADSPALLRALEAGAELDDGALIVTRTMTVDGRSRCHLGGRSVPVGVVATIAEALLAMHGQHDQQRLQRPVEQRALLDRYAGEAVGKPLRQYRALYERWREVTEQLEDITEHARERAQEADLLRHGLAEIAAAAPQPGEADELAADVARLAHADLLRTAATSAHESLVTDPTAASGVDASGLVAGARTHLATAAGHDTGLDTLAERLAEVSYLLADVAADLGAYAESVEADPARLEQAQQRQAALAVLTRKYAPDLPGVLAWAEQAAARLREVDDDDDRVTALAAEQEELVRRLHAAGAALSAARQKAGDRLAAAVGRELAALAMPDAQLSVAIDSDHRFGPDGVDSVELLLVPHQGAPPRPVHRGASGGELSRVMLAIEVVLAGTDPVPTMVFDEVDAGVGGRAAVEVGRRLARLARTHQVFVVTHLPQVAAFADRHVHVAKDTTGGVTRSGVAVLDDAARVRELSRMLAGLDDSDLARGHAAELLAAAAAAKSDA